MWSSAGDSDSDQLKILDPVVTAVKAYLLGVVLLLGFLKASICCKKPDITSRFVFVLKHRNV